MEIYEQFILAYLELDEGNKLSKLYTFRETAKSWVIEVKLRIVDFPREGVVWWEGGRIERDVVAKTLYCLCLSQKSN